MGVWGLGYGDEGLASSGDVVYMVMRSLVKGRGLDGGVGFRLWG